MNFAVKVVSAEEIRALVQSNAMGTRYEMVATVPGEDGKEYAIFAERDEGLSLIAVAASELD